MALAAQESKAFFTIVSNNYFHYAKTLFDSIRAIPEYANIDFYTAIVDKNNVNVNDYKDMQFIRLNELNIEDLDIFLFRYNILEANTAVKPFVFEKLLEKYQEVVYFDPDIFVYKPLTLDNIDKKSLIGILTPHITEPIQNDGSEPCEQTYMKYGLYNLGFITLFQNYKTAKFLEWWKDRLSNKCYNDANAGLFTDQKWIDLAFVLFKDFHICYDKSWNIAYWNITEREKALENPTFIHYSGFSSKKLSIHQTRFDKVPDCIKSFVDNYSLVLNQNNNLNYNNIKYHFNYFKDGSQIHQWQRDFYRTCQIKYENPFNHSNLFIPENIIKHSNINNLGFYHNEIPILGKYKWMQKAGYVKLPSGGKVRVVGYFDGYQKPHNILSFIVNDKLINTTAIVPGEFDISFNIPNISNQILKILSHSSFIPKQEKMGEDTRELSVKIQSISIEEESDTHIKSKYIINFSDYKEIESKNNGKGINVFGYGHSESGIGQIMRGFDTLDLPINNVILHDLLKPNKDKDITNDGYNDNNSYNLFIINGDEDYLTKFPYNYFCSKYNIGYWNWELENIPESWLKNQRVLQEVWCSSSFIQKSLSKRLKLPCVVVPPVVEFNAVKISKQTLGLPDKFIFLNIFDSKSVINRKNPIDLINTFNYVFKDNKNVCLIIKTDASFEGLKEYEETDKIIIIRENWTKDKIHSLQYNANCFVSLHRSEGFGLNIAESMYLGIPVITTDYSGNTDFCKRNNSLLVDYTLVPVGEGSSPYSPNDFWAQPDLDHAGWLMREIFEHANSNYLGNPKLAYIGKNGKETIKSLYSKSSVLKTVNDRLFYIDAK